MTLFRSLVFRDLKLTCRHYLLRLLLTAGVTVLIGLLVLLDLGPTMPMKGLDTPFQCELVVAMMYAVPVIAGVLATSDNGIYRADINAGWHIRFLGYPARPIHYTAADFAVQLAALILFGAVCLLGGALLSLLFGVSLIQIFFSTYLLAAAFGTFCTVPYRAVIMRVRQKKYYKRIAWIAAIFALVFMQFAMILYIIKFGLIPMDWPYYDMNGEHTVYEFILMPQPGKTAAALLTSLCISFAVTWFSLSTDSLKPLLRKQMRCIDSFFFRPFVQDVRCIWRAIVRVASIRIGPQEKRGMTMKTFRSLLFREMKLTRKRFFIMLILYILIAFLMMIPLILIENPLMSDAPSDTFLMLLVFCGTVSLIGGILAGTNNGLQKADINAGWKRYSFVLPPTSAQQAMSDLLMKLCRVLLFGLLSVVYTMIYAEICEIWEFRRIMEWNLDIVTDVLNIYLITVSLAMLVDVAYSYIIMFAKSKKELRVIGAAAFLGAGMIMKVLDVFTGDVKATEQPAEDGALISAEAFNRFMTVLDSEKTTLCAAAALAVICVLFFLVMWRSHERREP